MEIAERQVGDVVIWDLNGELVLGDAILARRVTKLADSGKGKVLLNLADVPHVDSAGLGELVHCYTTLSHKGGQLKLLNPNTKLRDLLSTTMLNEVFETYESEDEAVKSFARVAAQQ
jgi:anti-sigma B factor antagonist